MWHRSINFRIDVRRVHDDTVFRYRVPGARTGRPPARITARRTRNVGRGWA
jgi:hypothetical protein